MEVTAPIQRTHSLAKITLAGILLSIQTSTGSTRPSIEDGKAYKEEKKFHLTYGVTVQINASYDQVWKILTNGSQYPKWNSTVDSLKGRIEKGQKIVLHTNYSDRSFKLKVKKMENAPSQHLMVWGSGSAPMFKGERIYTVEKGTSETVCQFTMIEHLGGLMLPMIKKSLPDFRPSFEQFAADLKKEAEKD